MSWLGQQLVAWKNFWRRMEGPELEPPLWHSHFLSYRVCDRNLTRLGNLLNGLVIDVGAGTGHGIKYLDRARCEYFPTDLPTGRASTDKNISLEGLQPVFNCSAYHIPFPDNHFSGAMMLSVMEHLEFPQRALAEIFRGLKKGGYLLISTPFAFPVHGAPEDYRRWTLNGMEHELKEAGFEIVEGVACGSAFSTLTMNLHLTIRYHVLKSSKVAQALIALLLPVLLLTQAIFNALALLLDRLDSSRAFPLAIAILARKPIGDA